MNWFEALVLGAIQGLSEFLPISSSAHLIIVQRLFKIQVDNSLEFEIFLHLASLLAVLIYFKKDLVIIIKGFISYIVFKRDEDYISFRFGCFLMVSTLITGLLGKMLQSMSGDSITNSATIGLALIITGIFLILIEHGIKPGERNEKRLKWRDAIVVGFGQSLAIFPGISRAGSTLVTALWSGLSKETAVRYSFLLSIPIILSISILELPSMSLKYFKEYLLESSIAFAASFIFAIIGIKWLIVMVNKTKLSYFALYCILLGGIAWLFL